MYNLNRCTLAQNLLHQRIFKNKSNVCIVSEQYLKLQSNTWYIDKTGMSANPSKMLVDNSGRGAGCVRIGTTTVTIMSGYLSLNEGICVFRQNLASIESTVSSFLCDIIVVGNFAQVSTL